ncbi:DUF1176 domain-containing protein [Pseudomonas sp. UBA6562]|uniref:DUF1176 domain-containing protein n=1 Tax=Pseudomonas sp. UBA6562 TaxID=1947332 RepID=UPI0025CB7F6F|nr:DUF1176 domain-containing protein [Pseudomonas sp. UBA6562]
MRRLLALLPCLIACASHAADTLPLSRDLKDWNVTCDNLRTCTAVSTRPASAEADALSFPLRIVREAGPDGVLRVSVFSYNAIYGDPSIDAKPASLPLRSHQGSADDVSEVPELRSATGDDALTFIKALRNAHGLAFDTPDGPTSASLNGMRAALLLIDDIQGRVGTVTALANPGDAPASSVPAAPAPPVIPAWSAPTALDEAQAKQVLKTAMAATRAHWQQDLVDGDEPKGEVHALTAREALLIVRAGCGAYNCTYSLYLTPLAHPEQAHAAPFERVANLPDLAPNGSVAFDPATGELTSLALASGMGGCGVAARWRYDGARFVLSRAAQMSACAGLNERDWPVLWQSATKR